MRLKFSCNIIGNKLHVMKSNAGDAFEVADALVIRSWNRKKPLDVKALLIML